MYSTLFVHAILLAALAVAAAALSIASPPSELFVGGFFNVFDSAGTVDREQLEHAAAFVQAIEDINADTSILPGCTLRFAIRPGHGFHGAADAASELLALPLLAGAVNALPDYETHVVIKSLSEKEVSVVSSLADGAEFGDSATYPYKAQTVPPLSFVGMVLQDFLCHHDQTRIVTFVSDDYLGTKIGMELLDGSYCPIEELGHYTSAAWETDFTLQIDRALDTGATIYVIALSSPEQTALLMHQAFDAGMFREGSQVYLTEPSVVHYFPAGVEIADVLHGTISVSLYPEYSLKTTSAGKAFVEAWGNRAPWVGVCDSELDGTGVKYLRDGAGGCAELDFAAYKTGAQNISATTVLTYDATIALAHALHMAVQSAGALLLGDDIHGALIHNVSFTGASGAVDFFEGSSQRNGYGRGNREVGFHYAVRNFHQDNFDEDPEAGLAFVGFWDIDSSVLTSPAEIGVSYEDFNYNTDDNEPASAFPPYTFGTPPKVLKIGAVFSTITSDGALDDAQAEHLEAFLMAVEEINEADDILPDSKLVFALSNYAPDKLVAVQAVDYFLSAFYSTGVLGVVNALPSSTALATEMVTSVESMFQVLSNAGDTDLGNAKYHPFKAQTNVLDTFSGAVLQQLLCHYYEVTRVVTISSATDYGVKTTLEFKDGSACTMHVLAAYSFPSGTTDFSSIIDEALGTGALIFVLIMDATEAAQMLTQGYERGLFSIDTEVFATNVTDIANRLPVGADAPSVLKGVMSVHFYPEYSILTSEEGKNFTQRWLARKDLSNSIDCPNTLDYNGEHNLYHNDAFPDLCTTPNITAYRKGIKKLSPEAALTYDAVYVLAHGLHSLVTGNINITGSNLRQAVFDNVSFQGASGYINIFEGMTDLGGYAQGCRETGIHFSVLNFNEDLYFSDPTSGGFGLVGVWDVDSHELQPCLEGTVCYAPEYRSSTGSFPSDIHPTVVLAMSPGVRSFLQALSALIFLFGSGVLAVVVYHRSHAEVRRAQEVLLYFILVGILLAGGRVLVASLPLSTDTCTVGLWLGHLSFVFTFGALFLKSWRVNMLLNTKTIKRVVITNTNVVVKMIMIAVGLVAYMVLLTVVGKPHLATKSSESKNQVTKDSFCSLDVPQIHGALFIAEGVVLAYGMALCWAIRNVPDRFNESVNNAAAIFVIVALSALIFPVVFLLGVTHDVSSSIASIGFAVAALSSLTILFGQKVFRILGISQAIRKIHTRVAGSKAAGNQSADDKGSEINDYAKLTTDEERFDYCRKQILEWQGRMLAVNSDLSSTDVSKSEQRVSSSGVQAIRSSNQSYASQDLTNTNTAIAMAVLNKDPVEL